MDYGTRNPTLKKPGYADTRNVVDLNDNIDYIDGIIGKANLNATVDPAVTDDSGDGYAINSLWINLTGHRIFIAEGVTVGAAVWRQIYPALTTDLSGTITNAQLAGSISNDKLLSATGWIAGPALTYDAADAPNYTVTCTGDYSAIIMPGMRVKLTQGGAVKYFIVVKSAFSTPNTTLTLYGGTDYTLGATITLPYYSMLKAPAGFPLDPTKWTVTTTNSSAYTQNPPVVSTWYNLGSLSISLPIGIWSVEYRVYGVAEATDYTGYVSVGTCLSTANNTAGDISTHASINVAPTLAIARFFRNSSVIAATSKTAYYLNETTSFGGTPSKLEIHGDWFTTTIKAVSAYL